ncbi:oocyte zinc finger protein XlCOF7.1-like isoform X2 [Bufo gargarizans]|uniref:oocyte zinc finger protein XlCOF7.1-like isoform X2 n=1 Tax=Bufo gargarizans TaxID=30331 RepID=UPI001CF2FADE|nr:oocyte zinc finger protein XlCOF7.1-like isoform X2 [Bufo gargarizans]
MMNKNRNTMAKRILNITLEIIYLLTGKDYTLVKKTSSEHSQAMVSEGLLRLLSPITEPPPQNLIQEEINEQKILELANKISELLTGEVSFRCQDVIVCFSMEEWEYLEEHKEMYKDIMMENNQLLTSDDFSKKSTPESCPSTIYSQDCPGERHNVQQDYKDDDLNNIKIEVIVGEEEACMLGYQPCKKETISTAISPDDWTGGSKEDFVLSSYNGGLGGSVIQDNCGEQYITPNVPLVLHSRDLSTDPTNHKDSSSSQSQTVKQNRGHGEERLFPCSEYETCFKTISNLSKHNSRIHRNENSFSCPECGKCFKKKSNLSIHKRIHRDERKFACPECGKCFTTKSDLVKHKRIHTGEKPFSCSECGRCFTWKSDLVKHQRIHTGEKPFSCLDCGKCFTRKSDLVKHERIHTGKKPYSCSECAKCFTQRSNLVEHQKIHTGQRPFSCSECRRCFTRKSNLVEHLRIHTGEKLSLGLESGKLCTMKGPVKKTFGVWP